MAKLAGDIQICDNANWEKSPPSAVSLGRFMCKDFP